MMRVLPLLLFGLGVFAQEPVWEIDPAHSAAQFTVRHMMISNVKGEFTKMKGTVRYDPADPAKAAVEATIEAASINTRVEGRDKHLRSADFFDVAQYPTIAFKSKRVENAGGKLKLIGDLTMHGTTREVALDVDGPTPPVKDQRGTLHMGASATTKINRKDFGLTWSRPLDGGGVVVGDEVSIVIDLELVQRPAR
ncbi:MAG: YceI family protein [Bryobacteraceae bacterium]